jgi:HK97 gp10 family phage protein
MADFEITGMDEMNKNLEKIIKSVAPEVVEPILLKSAKMLEDDIRSRAPFLTGRLKASIVSKVLKRWSEDKAAPAIVAINYRVAPHAPLVEFGTVHAAPHPYFRPGWDANAGRVEDDIKAGILDSVNKAAGL